MVDVANEITAAAKSVKRATPMFFVHDMRATIQWYESIGFSVEESFENRGELVFAKLSFGDGEFALSPGGEPGPRTVNLWFFTDRVEDLYHLFKKRQQSNEPSASSQEAKLRFEEELYEPFYGGRQFSILDNNDLELVFWQPPWMPPPADSM